MDEMVHFIDGKIKSLKMIALYDGEGDYVIDLDKFCEATGIQVLCFENFE